MTTAKASSPTEKTTCVWVLVNPNGLDAVSLPVNADQA